MADRQTTAERLAETIRVALDLGLQAWRTTDSRERFIEAQDALSRLVGEHDTLRNTLREIAECAGWYAKNSDRIALEVDHALCVEVLSYAEDALAAADSRTETPAAPAEKDKA